MPYVMDFLNRVLLAFLGTCAAAGLNEGRFLPVYWWRSRQQLLIWLVPTVLLAALGLRKASGRPLTAVNACAIIAAIGVSAYHFRTWRWWTLPIFWWEHAVPVLYWIGITAGLSLIWLLVASWQSSRRSTRRLSK